MHPEVTALLVPYLWALLWSAPPLLGFTVFRRYLQAMDVVKPITVALVSANMINAAANWILVSASRLTRAGRARVRVRDGGRAHLHGGVLCAVVVIRERRRPSGLRDVPFVIGSRTDMV